MIKNISNNWSANISCENNKKVQFHLAEPVIKYHQKTYNNCCLSSSELAFRCINDNRDVHSLVNTIEESFNLEKGN